MVTYSGRKRHERPRRYHTRHLRYLQRGRDRPRCVDLHNLPRAMGGPELRCVCGDVECTARRGQGAHWLHSWRQASEREELTMAMQVAECSTCLQVLAFPAKHAAWAISWACPDCGTSLGQVSPVRKTPPRIRPQRVFRADIDERDIRTYVGQALEFNAQRARREKAAHMDSSTMAPALSAAMLGIVGNGCTGTKRGWRPMEHEIDPRDCHVDPELADRYVRLTGQALRITDEVIGDQAGFQDVSLPFGSRSHELTIYQRVSLRMAPDTLVQKWHEKFASGDAEPAKMAAEREGRGLLMVGAKGWWGRKGGGDDEATAAVRG